jgi:hypothetical protein
VAVYVAYSSTSCAGNISTWDDQRIKDLNTEIANLLPSQPITVITQNVSSTLTQLFVSVLRSHVPEFAAQVGSSTNPTFPVQSTNRSLVTTDAEGVMPLLSSKSYSLAFWQHYDILLVSSLFLLLLYTTLVPRSHIRLTHSLTHAQSRNTAAASLKINNNTVTASDATVSNALEEYLASNSLDKLAFNSLSSGASPHTHARARALLT